MQLLCGAAECAVILSYKAAECAVAKRELQVMA
jgi:hypothetical protein